MSILHILTVSLGAVLAENIIFVRFLGVAPMLSASEDMRVALPRGAKITALLTAASLAAWLLDTLILAPLGIEYMRTFIYVLVICGGMTVFENTAGKKAQEGGHETGVSHQAVLSASMILGVMLITSNGGYGFFEAIFSGFFSGAAFTGASIAFSALREHLEYAEIPAPFGGLPIYYITLGLISLVFMGFYGMKLI